MDGTNFKDIVEYIRSIAEPMVTAGYEVVLKQVKFEMVWNAVLVFILIISTLLLVKLVKYSIEKESDKTNTYTESGWIAGIIFGIVGALGTLGLSIACLYNFLNALINPDWVAIEMILRMVTGAQ